MILVTGAAGKTGKAVINALLNRNVEICAFVRSVMQANALPNSNLVKVVVGDLRNSEDLIKASNKADAIYYICPNITPDEIEIGKQLVNAARINNVQRFVYHSVLHPQIESMPHHWQKMRMEEFLFSSGLDFTILQPCAYMQNILSEWKDICQDAVYMVPYSIHSRLSIVDLLDIGEAAAIVLTEKGHSHSIYELSGPNPLSQVDIANIISTVINKPVNAIEIGHSVWKDQAIIKGITVYEIGILIKMFEYYKRNGLVGNPLVLKTLLDREPTQFIDFVRRHISSLGV
jgi:uncharacterized protein YbjT (DUF2867 family)